MTTRLISEETPRYLEIAWGELDIAEIPGPEDCHRIRHYHDAAGGESPDEVPWCSSFVNWCVREAGLRGTGLKSARSWLRWGHDCGPEYGAVTVLWRVEPGGWQGHVGFLVGMTPEMVYLLGGNQSNRVRVSGYPVRRILGFRRPADGNGVA